ncbi:MAG: hypothetical protein AB4050_12370 [Synechococcus sp.]
MIDLTRPITLVDYPHLWIYPDIEDSARYYTFAQPHLSLIEGAVDMTLMTYQKRGITTGGQLNLTTSLGLSPAEQLAVTAALTAKEGNPPHFSSPDWRSGTVTVEIDDILTLTGQPTLMGDNRCVLSASLTAEQAQTLSKLWQSDKEWLSLCYSVQFVGWDVAETKTTSTANQPGQKTCQSSTMRQTTARNISRQLTCQINPVNGKRVEIKLDKR